MIIDRLESVIAERKRSQPGSRSYVRTLMDGGVPAISAKISEEAVELVAAGAESGEPARAHQIHEAADLFFHTLVLLGFLDIHWSEVEQELARRFGIGGLDEKAARTGTPPTSP